MSLEGKRVVFSGFRDKKLEQSIEEKGGKVTSAVSGLTNILVVKDLSDSSDKITKAKEKTNGIIIIQKDAFISKYIDGNAKTPSPKAPSPPKSTKKTVTKKSIAKKSVGRGYAKLFYIQSRDDVQPFTATAAAKLLGKTLEHGDVIAFEDDNRFSNAMFIVNSDSWVKNYDITHSGYLSPPLKVTESLSDARKFYKKLHEELQEDFTGMYLGKNDVFMQKLFKSSSDILAHAEIAYLYNEYDGDFLVVNYKGKEEAMTIKGLTQAKIEAAFATNAKVEGTVTVELHLRLNDKNDMIDPSITADDIKKLMPSGAWTVKKNGNVFTITGPVSQVEQLKKNLRKATIKL